MTTTTMIVEGRCDGGQAGRRLRKNVDTGAPTTPPTPSAYQVPASNHSLLKWARNEMKYSYCLKFVKYCLKSAKYSWNRWKNSSFYMGL